MEPRATVEIGFAAWLARADRLCAEGHAEAALRCYRRALQEGADPDLRIGERFRCSLACGDYASAWQEGDRVQQLRSAQDDGERQIWERFVWNGRKLDGRRVLVRCWDGHADTIQFIRYLPHLAAHAETVACEVEPGMIALFAASLPSVQCWVPLGKKLPPHDEVIQASELAHYFRTVPETIPAAPYLFAPPDTQPSTRKRVGLAWHDGGRTPSFDTLRPLLSVPEIEFVALQRGAGRYEAAASGVTVVDECDALSLARLVASLDLVISADTMAAHLAGALGVPVWTLLDGTPEWRWTETRDDTPWYASMRLFRESEARMARVCAALQRWSESAESGPRNWRSTIDSHAAP
ncbi:glycosyltransferase family 9 protein [Roseiterribacter gracilis]|uniref:Uncharacterized protein n=1 Tax=Roseiterribacter gracilis TaxID=2812848 RepID=A0A8S8XAF0_9PROT|nr:hypothetical protein TMPK1_19710 [Rhodospirillales bacterium TMPK1]